MNNKGFVNILIIIAIIAVLFGAAEYYILTKKPESPAPTSVFQSGQEVLPGGEEGVKETGGEEGEHPIPPEEIFGTDKPVATSGSSEFPCAKEENCCTEDTDCKYIWYTGGCYTPEYVAKKQEEAMKQGRLIGEARPRENVTCTCENNECVTHN